jgi:peptidoglycan/LPS O-acetylase OafA/YrhL
VKLRNSAAPGGDAGALALAPPPGNEKIPGLDGLRGLMVLTVVLFHAADDSGALVGTGWSRWAGGLTFGPDVFMMISGFLLYRPYVSARVRGTPRPRLLNFYRKRVLRVFPGYWVAITLAAIYPGLPGIFSSDWWKYYGLLHIYFSDSVFGGLAVSWTLCTEVSFYLLIPLIAYVADRLARGGDARMWRRLEIAALVIVSALAVEWHHHFSGGNVLTAIAYARALWLPGLACYFAIGMIMALLTVPLPGERHPRELIPSIRWLTVGCFALAFVAYWVKAYSTSLMDEWVLNGVVSLLLFVPASLARPGDGLARFLTTPALEYLAVVSFGVYLYHRSFVKILLDHGFGGHSFLDYVALSAVAIALSLVAAQISYKVVEEPFLRLKYGSKRPKTASAS